MIFETLYLLFKTDTKEVKKGTEEAKKSTMGLKTSLKESTEFSDKLQKSFTGLSHSIFGIVAAGLSASAVFSGLKNAADFSVALSQQAQQLGVNISSLNAYGNVMQSVGGSTEEFGKDLQALATNFGTTPAIALKFLPALAHSYRQLNKLQANQYGASQGISPHMVQVLQMGNDELAKMIAHQQYIGVLTEDDEKKFLGFNLGVIDTKNSLTFMFSKIVEAGLPAINAMTSGLTAFFSYVSHHKSLVEGAFYGIAIAAGALATAFLLMNPVVLIVGGSIAAIVAGCALLKAAFDELSGGTPEDTFDKLGKGAQESIGWLGGVKDIIDGIAWAIKEVIKLFDEFTSFQIGRSEDVKAWSQAWQGNGIMNLMQTSPINGQSTASIGNSSSTNINNTSNVDSKVTINTKSDNPKEVTKQVHQYYNNVLAKANNGFATGAKS